ncbi:MAG: glycosyltransferase family A protein [Candidatus Buchananbacteria bacterium]|nr:glycosyltransferase family A protein [Candidatus Buchananbacteria bacterium]
MLSVIIPTYNRAAYLDKSLSSLTKQNYPKDDFEVVIVDDGSKDETAKITSKFKNDLNLKYFRENHLGVSHARNVGIRKSIGEVVVFFDDDALVAENWLESISRIMVSEDIITGKVKPIKSNIWQYFAPHYNQGDKPKESPVLLEGNCAIKRKVFSKIGLFDENLDYGHEGEEFIYRVGKNYKIMYYPEVIIYHDYAKSFLNYFQKQKKFGQKKAYLESRGFKRASSHQIKNHQIDNLNFVKKITIKIIARLGAMFHFWGHFSYKK